MLALTGPRKEVRERGKFETREVRHIGGKMHVLIDGGPWDSSLSSTQGKVRHIELRHKEL